MSTDTKRPKNYHKAPVTEYRCQFCHVPSPVVKWRETGDVCPKCGRASGAIEKDKEDEKKLTCRVCGAVYKAYQWHEPGSPTCIRVCEKNQKQLSEANRQIRNVLKCAATMGFESNADDALLQVTQAIFLGYSNMKYQLEAINTPELLDFQKAVSLEAQHQRLRWSTQHDAGKEPQDWFWLIGYLGGKALRAHIEGNTEKALHHTISTAAALANWHAAILGATNMRPGIDPVERGIEELHAD